MKKEITLTGTIENNHLNVKLRLPPEWLNELEVNRESRLINITSYKKTLIVKKATEMTFKLLTQEEKNLQILKFKELYEYKYETRKNLLAAIEEYFKITYRTAYRCLNNKVDPGVLERTVLLEEQQEYYHNLKVMFKKVHNTEQAFISIPTKLAIKFLTGHTYSELGIKSAYDIYKENFSVKVELKFNKKNSCIIIIKIESIKND